MHSLLTILLDFKFPVSAFKQIVDVIKIKFDETDTYCKLPLVESAFDGIENILDGEIEVSLLNGIASKDGVCLASACLSVSEEGSIIPLEDGLD